MTMPAQVCLIVAATGLGELGAAVYFLLRHAREQREASAISQATNQRTAGRPRRSLLLGAVLCVSALMSFGIAAFMWFVIAPLGAPRDRAAAEFIAAAQAGDSARMKTLLAPSATLDEAFFAGASWGRETLEPRNYDLALGGQSCLEYEVDDKPFWLYLEEEQGRWLIVRAGPQDPECENQLRSE